MEYCLRIKITAERADAYENWLKEHAQEVVNHPGFLSCHVLRGPSLDEPGWTMFHTRYLLKDEQSFRDYLSGPAQKMRQEGLDKFGPFVTIQRDLVSTSEQLVHQGE